MRGFRDEDHRTDAPEPVRINDVHSIGETTAAVQCVIPGRDVPVWIPKSQIDDDSEVYADEQHGTLIVTAWLAEREGLE